ncbi:YihA5, YihA/EngB-like GTPase [Ectocarpus siliculosus]|uniref:YihA5, YihA/EngB-like GTPase n=1 Tax=Ectocarpus siliculosus TaxID=2880 RepID=D8LT72_ECTSI|nr:YihA5, YihA/EngB-like GTPase [Ectocarpus siliculosus]|eukprot:CBN77943.1 YihA5, YihA/EngB-like GTPase [Ectocarpus siliculosus]
MRLEKLAKWKAMMQSGELEEIARNALSQDVMEQEEDMEAAGSRRTGRKNRNKAEPAAQSDDLSDLDMYFDKQSDWRDSSSSAAPTTPAGPLPSSGQAAGRRRGKAVEGDDLAAQLAAGLGLNVVAPSSSSRPSTGTEEEAATAMHEKDGRYQDDSEEEEEEMMMMDEDSSGARLGGWFNDGQNASRRERTRAIRKEEKEGKSAEKVIAMVVSAAERDGVRDDRYFSFALKTLARMGRLDLSLRVNEMRETYLEDGELESHDRMTTAGLAVACLRAGDETSALEMLESAVKPYSSSTPEENEELQVEQEEEEEEEEEEEGEDWEALEAEEELEKILEAEGEVLPELLDFYLERGHKESSQEAAAGLRKTLDRALRQGDFAPSSAAAAAAAPSSLSAPPPSGALTVWAYNQLIRRLGKADRLSDVFEVLDGMARLGVENNHETLEFATNAAIKEVEFETRAVSMKTLPSGKAALPEVVFVGRSNVGKSSLVNMLVNRKTLAPTSAVPGFTQHFNYYAVNKGRRKSPSFFLVDVPGLGYARADDGRMDSWKSTLQRYLGVRENLRVVFHLIDGRTGLQKADEQLISLMMNENEGRSSYVVVVTKCDKVNDKKLKGVTEKVRQTLDKNGFPKTTPVIPTSAKSRQGRVELLGYLRLVFDVDRRKGKGPAGATAAGPPQEEWEGALQGGERRRQR